MELNALTLATRSYALLSHQYPLVKWCPCHVRVFETSGQWVEYGCIWRVEEGLGSRLVDSGCTLVVRVFLVAKTVLY